MQRKRFHPSLDGLEQRNLMAIGDITVSGPVALLESARGRVAVVQGTPGPDYVYLDFTRTVRVNGTKVALLSDVLWLALDLNEGDDVVENLSPTFAVPVVAHGGNGADSFRMASNGVRDKLYGDAGPDSFSVPPGSSFAEENVIYENNPFNPYNLDALDSVPWLYVQAPGGNANNVVGIDRFNRNITIDGSLTVHYGGMTGAIIDLNDGNDRIVSNDDSLPLLIFGGNGDDSAHIRRRDRFFGELGDDLEFRS